MQKKNKVGSPLTYTPELGEEICITISTTSEGLETLCKLNPHWPNPNTIYEWRLKLKEFGEMYTKAKKSQVEVLVDEILAIADDNSQDYITNDEGKLVYNSEHVNRSRLRIDTRKWFAAKLAPRIYGDKVENTHTFITQEEALKALL
ncbi:MAG TPA: hypothetical protein VHZ50_01710 [Puia sp.]|jgi:hypothetical protein|nr:hypothetical protein [Puia sp.]